MIRPSAWERDSYNAGRRAGHDDVLIALGYLLAVGAALFLALT